MAKKASKTARKKVKRVKAVRVAAEDSVVPDTANDPTVGIPSVFETTAEDSYVNVYRLHELRKQWDYQFRLAPHEATEEVLQEYRGGGTYRLIERRRGDSGRYEFGRQTTVKIDGPVKELTKLPPGAEMKPPGGRPSNVVEEDEAESEAKAPGVGISEVMTAGVINLLNAHQTAAKSQAQAFEAMLAKAMGPGVDWGQALIAFAPVLLKLLERRESRSNSSMDTVEMIAKVAGLLKDNTSPASSLRDQVEVMNNILGIKEKAQDLQVATATDPVDTLVSQLPKFLEIMQEEQAAKRGKPRPTLPPESSDQNVEPWKLILRSRKAYLLDAASRDKDAVLLGEAEYELMPEQYRGVVAGFIGLPNAFELIMAELPELRQYQAWAGRFFASLHRQFFPELTEQEPETQELEGQESEAQELEGREPEVEH